MDGHAAESRETNPLPDAAGAALASDATLVSSATGPLQDARTTRRRQMLWLALLVIGILVLAFGGMLLNHPAPLARGAKATEKNVLPGASVQTHDAWVATEGARIAAYERENRELKQRVERLEREQTEALKRSSGASAAVGGAASLPPGMPPGLPPAMPAGGMPRNALPAPVPPTSIPPASISPALATGVPVVAKPPAPPAGAAKAPRGFETIEFEDRRAPAAHDAGAAIDRTEAAQSARISRPTVVGTPRILGGKGWMPAGTFMRVTLLSGLDAPTGQRGQNDPYPVLLRITDQSVLPNEYRGQVQGCFVVGSGFGDLASERARIRTETLSCIARNGTAIEVTLRGWVIGEDGAAGVRGQVISKQGAAMRNALIAGILSGVGSAMRAQANTVSVSPLGATSTVVGAEDLARAGVGTGVQRAADRLSQFYINLAEQMLPTIEIGAGRTVEIALSRGVNLGEFYAALDEHAEAGSALGERNRAMTSRLSAENTP